MLGLYMYVDIYIYREEWKMETTTVYWDYVGILHLLVVSRDEG